VRKQIVVLVGRQNRSTGAGSAQAEKWSKKGILRNWNRWHVMCFPRPPTLSQSHMDLHVWSYPRCSYIFQVLSKSVQWAPRGRNLPLSITLAVGFCSACTTIQAMIFLRCCGYCHQNEEYIPTFLCVSFVFAAVKGYNFLWSCGIWNWK